ncbi:Holliday junction resolvase RuvX [Candidatus Dojkabacteria bacterium]|nr:Holliday junction resolvase RuvX [Candidatus Dojkabacteria bacterium]
MKTLAIDFGTKRIGIAVSDELGIAAAPIKIIKGRTNKEAIEEIARIYNKLKVQQILIGIPLKPDGSHGKEANLIKDFAEELNKKITTRIIFWDEYLSSKIAEKNSNGRKDIDDQAAAIILQEFLNSSEQ